MSLTPDKPEINNIVDIDSRLLARKEELTQIQVGNDRLGGCEPHYVAQDRALREHRDRTLQDISERYDNQPSFIGRWFKKLGL